MTVRATRNTELYHLHTSNLCEDTLKENCDLTLKFAEGVDFVTWRETHLYMEMRKIISYHTHLSLDQHLIQSSTSPFFLIPGIIINGGRRTTSFPSNTPFTAENQASSCFHYKNIGVRTASYIHAFVQVSH